MNLRALSRLFYYQFRGHLRALRKHPFSGGLAILFVILLVSGLFFGTREGLRSAPQVTTAFTITPAMVFALSLQGTFLVALFSGLVTLCNLLFFSQDQELLRKSPVPLVNQGAATICYCTVLSSLPLLLLVSPIFLAIGAAYGGGILFFTGALTTLFGIHLTGISLSLIALLLLVQTIPLRYIKGASLLLLSGTLLVLLAIAQGLRAAVQQEMATTSLDKLGALFQATMIPPFSWLGVALEASTSGELSLMLFSLPLFAIFSLLSAIGSFARMYEAAFQHFVAVRAALAPRGKRSLTRKVRFLTGHPISALMAKEGKLFLRDISQTGQLVLVLFVLAIYVANMQKAALHFELAPWLEPWFRSFLLLVNFGTCGLVTAAIAARFIFPSVSLEGQTLWLLQKAPLTFTTILRAKLYFWSLVLSSFASIIIFLGGISVQASVDLVLITTFASLPLAICLSALALFFGTQFVQLEWRSSTEIYASVGNVFFMIVALCVVGITMIPVAMLLLLVALRNTPYVAPPEVELFVAGTVVLACSIAAIAAVRLLERSFPEKVL